MTVTYTLAQLADDTLQQLRGIARDTVNVLAQSLDAPAAHTIETIYFQGALVGIVQGSLLSLGEETMYVQAVSNAQLSAIVIRGFDSTTPATASAGALVYVDVPWPRKLVINRLKDEIRSWSPQVYQVASILVPIVNLQRGYDLSAISGEIIRILRVMAPQPPYIGEPGAWYQPGTTNATLSDISYQFRYDPNANTNEFASGRSLTITAPTTPSFIGEMVVVYATPFNVDDSWTETTDMIANVGMDSRDLDIPPLGAAARLLRMMSVRRAMLNVQGQSRDDQDVTMAAILQAANMFEQSTQSRLNDVQQRLYSDYPLRSSNY